METIFKSLIDNSKINYKHETRTVYRRRNCSSIEKMYKSWCYWQTAYWNLDISFYYATQFISKNQQRNEGVLHRFLPQKYDSGSTKDCWGITLTSIASKVNRAIGQLCRVFGNEPEDWVSIPGRTLPKAQRWYLMLPRFNTPHYMVRIKGKVEQSREWSSTLLYILV